jgi:putative hydrolase of the HAD superfamily
METTTNDTITHTISHTMIESTNHGGANPPASMGPEGPTYRRPGAAPVAAVLFDRDGVLTYFDTGAASEYFRPLLPISIFALAARWQAAGAEHGSPRNLAEERAFFDRFWNKLADEFALNDEQRERLVNINYPQFIVPFPEVRGTLGALRTAGVKLGVLSNFSLASLDHSLVSIGLGEFFDVICAAPVIGVSKPDLRAYQIAVDALGVAPQNCLFFDDEVDCVEGGRRAGLQAYLVDRRAPADDHRLRVVTDLTAVIALAGVA